MALPEHQQQQQNIDTGATVIDDDDEDDDEEEEDEEDEDEDDEEDDDEEEEEDHPLFTPQHHHYHQSTTSFLDAMSHTSTLSRSLSGFDDNMIRMQFDLFNGGGGVSNRFRSILSGLSNNNNNNTNSTSVIASLQQLSEILSISNEDALIGMFPCDSFVRELTRILNSSNEQVLDGHQVQADITMMDEETMIAFALNNSSSSSAGAGNIETMTLACQCLSNLLHALPSSASNILAHGAIEILCQKLEPSDYIDLPEQALSVSSVTHPFIIKCNQEGQGGEMMMVAPYIYILVLLLLTILFIKSHSTVCYYYIFRF